MIRDSVSVARLIGAIWFGDLSRSVTGTRTRSRVVLVLGGLLTIGWVVFAAMTSGSGFAAIPEQLQLQLLGELMSGTALASGCAASVLLVLTPSSREVEALLCAAPVGRGSWAMGRTVPSVFLAAAVAPLAMAPILASSVQLGSGGLIAPMLTGAFFASLAGAALLAVVIRGLEAALHPTGLPQPVVSSVAGAAALGSAAAAYGGFSRADWVATLPGGFVGAAWSAVATVFVIATIASCGLVVVVRLVPAEPIVPIVRWLRRCGSRGAGSIPTDLLQTGRNPLAVSTATLVALAAGAAALTTPPDSSAWPNIIALLLVAAPGATTLVLYGTNRRTLWIRSAVRNPRRSRYGAVKVTCAAILAGAAVLVVTVFATALGHAAVVPWEYALPIALLASSSSFLAGVHFPADLEMPGAPLLAFLEAAALTAVPYWLASKLPDSSVGLVLILAGIAIAAVAPSMIAIRRSRSVTG